MQPNPYKDKRGRKVCDPTGWYLAEKYDGIKARWLDGKLLTRSGKEINCPISILTELKATLAKHNVEGELYLGKNTFHMTASLRAENNIKQISWDKVTWLVFDLIDYKLTWLERQNVLQELKLPKIAKLVEWIEIKSADHLEEEFRKITKKSGEGVIIADPWGLYQDGHVDQILKYKAVQDEEAVVIGYKTDSPQQGNKATRLMSLEVCNRCKVKFHIGTGLKMSQRYDYEKRFPVGTTVTYTYELIGKNGKPRTPVFKCIRTDI